MLGDLDGDGSVGVSDLLNFLNNFGQNTGTPGGTNLYSNSTISVSNGPSVSTLNANTDVALNLSNPQFGQAGSLAASVDQAADTASFLSSSTVSMSAFTNKTLVIDRMHIRAHAFAAGQAFLQLSYVISAFNSAGIQIGTDHTISTTLLAPTGQAGTVDFFTASVGLTPSNNVVLSPQMAIEIGNGNTQTNMEGADFSLTDTSVDKLQIKVLVSPAFSNSVTNVELKQARFKIVIV